MTDYYGTRGSDRIDPRNPGNDYMYGDKGDDTIFGWDGDDTIDGWGDDDKLYGENGNDFLLGGKSEDKLYGGRGNDFLNGEQGDDTLKGGIGADTFFFDYPSDGVDTIRDFYYTDGDKIAVSAVGFGIGLGDFSKFSYSSSTGALYFEGDRFANLQPNLNFAPSMDMWIV